jgi:hypothetical protein
MVTVPPTARSVFRRLRGGCLYTIITLILAACMTTPLACYVPSSGLGLDLNDYGSFTVRPRFFCQGEPVTVSWQVEATETVRIEPPCSFGVFGVCIIGGGSLGGTVTRELGVQVFLSSAPDNLFALPPNRVPPDEDVGSRTVMLADDTTFTLFAVIEDLGTTLPEQREAILVPPDNPAFDRLRFSWSCDGWGPLVFERGELASEARIVSVQNLSSFPIHLVVKREGLPPPEDVVEVDLDAFRCTTAFNGEYYGQWVAAALNPAELGNPMCDGSSGGGTVVDTPNQVPGVEPLPDIELEVALACDGASFVVCPE